MPARTHAQWSAEPPLKQGEWVDSRIYSDPKIFDLEMERIFKNTWVPLCHESELPKAYDFRTFTIAKSLSSSAEVPTTPSVPFSTYARIAAC